MTPRQKEIVEHSISLIAHRGIQDLTIRNIADAIGISEPAIYRHFKSKTDVVLAVIDSLESSVFGASEAPGDPATRTLEEYVKRLLQRLEAAPDLAVVVFSDEVFMNNDKLIKRIRALMERSLSEITKLIRAGQRAGNIRTDVPPGDLALIFAGAVRLIVRQWHLSGFDFNLAERGKKMLRSLVLLTAPLNQE